MTENLANLTDAELARRLRYLSSVDFGGWAARACVVAMAEAAARLEGKRKPRPAGPDGA